MERAQANVISTPAEMALAEIETLDQALLAAVPGDGEQLAEWIERRHSAVQQLASLNPSPETLEVIHSRTARLEERFLHWRRSFIMELSLIDQHLCYLKEQRSGSELQFPTRLDVCG